MTLSEIAQAVNGKLISSQPGGPETAVSSVSIDTRTITPGALYVPIIGDRYDGHAFIAAARENGAVCTLSDRQLPNGPYILVPDTLRALQDLASHYRDKFDIPVIGVTGSVGKTSTKEMLAAVLSTRFHTLKNVGSYNNHTGVPLTLLRLEREHEVAVIEMGTNHFGEIDNLASIAKPTVCLFTNIGVAHIEFFGSREGILKGKTEMLAHKKPGGAVIVNGDDDMLVRVEGAMRYGFSEGCHVRAVDAVDHGLTGSEFVACYEGQRVPVTVPSPGRHSVSNALAAIAVGLTLGMSLQELAVGVAAFEPPNGRMCIRRTERLTVLDDSYNANPNSVMASIDVLEKVPGRKVCVLGDMLELGDQSDEYHEVVGMYAARHGIDLIVCVGPSSEQTFLGAHAIAPHGARYFENQDSMAGILPQLIRNGDTILIKAARGIHLENTVQMLLEL